MSTIVTRAGKGSPLTHVEVDANFTNLNTDKVEKTSAAITGGTINGTTIGATTPSTVNATTLSGETGVLRGTGQNLILRSQALATSPWFNGGLTSITNNTSDVTDPLGGNTATKIVGLSSPTVQQQNTLNTLVYTFSIYLRTLSGTVSTRIITYLAAAPFTTIGSTTISVTSSWQRFTFTTTAPPSAATYSFLIDSFGANTIYAWGAQGEIGSTANTYIPTTTTAVYGTPTLSFSGVSTIGLQSNGALFLQPAGTGAIQAQQATSTTAGGNVRGTNSVDWQTSRTAASQVSSGQYATIGGGYKGTASGFANTISGGETNIASGFISTIGGGSNNTSSASYTTVAGGYLNTNSKDWSFVGGGYANTANGFHNFIGAGFTNSGTANAAVTTQSGTMNATTAVTLSGSNANIKVGQLITGTSINTFPNTYVAAISGTSLTLSQVASGSSTSTLSFFTPHGVVVGGGNNQATGSYSFIGGGGDGGTAANRNRASADWSTVAGGWKNTASGIGATVAGGGTYDGVNGSGNTASGATSFVGGGFANTASGFGASIIGGNGNASTGNYTVVSGVNGTARAINNNFTISSNAISNTGDGQTSVLVLKKQTTDATATALTSDTAAAGTTNQVILPNNSAYYFRGEIVSGVTGGGDTKGFTIEGVIKRGANAASTALVGTPTVTSSYADAGAAAFAIAVTADTTNGGLRVTFTGVAATTIRTVCQIRTTEMTY